eukprot:4891002-Pleurochrysis_carterae.AAC.1
MWRASWRRTFARSLHQTQIRRTSALPVGTALRSMSSQLPLSVWLAISARSAAVQPERSSRKACLRVFGSALQEDARRTHPVLRAVAWGRAESRTVRSATGDLLRSGYAPRPRWKCSRSAESSASLSVSCAGSVGGAEAAPVASVE